MFRHNAAAGSSFSACLQNDLRSVAVLFLFYRWPLVPAWCAGLQDRRRLVRSPSSLPSAHSATSVYTSFSYYFFSRTARRPSWRYLAERCDKCPAAETCCAVSFFAIGAGAAWRFRTCVHCLLLPGFFTAVVLPRLQRIYCWRASPSFPTALFACLFYLYRDAHSPPW